MKFHVATRKGLFTFEKGSSGWGISRVDFLGDTVTMCLPDRRDGSLYAVLTLGHFGSKLRRTRDGGANWEELNVPVFPEGATVPPHPMGPPGSPASPASLKEIWALEGGGTEFPNRLWAGTIPGAVFVSEDLGQTWQINEPLFNRPERLKWFGGGKDESGVHSVCLDPRDSNKLSVAISCGGVWQTRDSGQSWECRSTGLRAEFMPPDQQFDPDIQDAHRMVQSPSAPDNYWIQHHNGIFKTTDDCQQWEEISSPYPTFGFAVAVHPHDPKTAWFVPGVKDECRVAVDAKLAIAKTTDGGKTFTMQRSGLPQSHCYDIAFRHALDVDQTGNTLVFGTTCGNLFISENGGDSWQCLSNYLPMIYTVRFA
jgi:photosystem II stability/assembly factor-like uncharacterized protein